jgi:hypothetical protein
MKNSITTAEELHNHIRLMKKRNRLLEDNIRLKFRNSLEALKPKNLIKNSFTSLGSNYGARRNIVSATVGLGLGYIAYRMIAGKSPNVLKRTTARAVQLGLTGVLAKKIGLWGRFVQDIIAKRRMRSGSRMHSGSFESR